MRNVLVVGLSLAFSACSQVGTEALLVQSAALESLSSGTSFGECLGYCETELSLDSPSVTFTEKARFPTGTPDRTRSIELTPAEWSRLRSRVSPAAIERLEGVHGCPDCADGGAEWIQLGAGNDSVRVTFEYGATLDGIAPLQAEIRALRDRFPR